MRLQREDQTLVRSEKVNRTFGKQPVGKELTQVPRKSRAPRERGAPQNVLSRERRLELCLQRMGRGGAHTGAGQGGLAPQGNQPVCLALTHLSTKSPEYQELWAYQEGRSLCHEEDQQHTPP